MISWNKICPDTSSKLQPRAEIFHVMSSLVANNLYGYSMSKFLLTSSLKWLDPKKFNLNECTSNSSKGCVLEVDLEYPKEFGQLHNDYPLAPAKIEIKGEILSDYQLKIVDFYSIPTGNVKKLEANFFDK